MFAKRPSDAPRPALSGVELGRRRETGLDLSWASRVRCLALAGALLAGLASCGPSASSSPRSAGPPEAPRLPDGPRRWTELEWRGGVWKTLDPDPGPCDARRPCPSGSRPRLRCVPPPVENLPGPCFAPGCREAQLVCAGDSDCMPGHACLAPGAAAGGPCERSRCCGPRPCAADAECLSAELRCDGATGRCVRRRCDWRSPCPAGACVAGACWPGPGRCLAPLRGSRP